MKSAKLFTERQSTNCSESNNNIRWMQQRMEQLEDGLSCSLNNQKLLQESVSFLIDNEKKLRQVIEALKHQSSHKEQSLKKQLERKNQQLDQCKRQCESYGQLLRQSGEALESTRQTLSKKQQQLKKIQGVVREQKKVIEEMQSERIYKNFESVEKSRMCTVLEDSTYYEMQDKYEKKIMELEVSVKRVQNALENEKLKSEKLEKQNSEFKKWLSKLIGIEAVVAGCEKLIMKEVQKRFALVQY